jgi:predicted metal-dependent phosphotriesterase family hydrolase
VRPKYNPEQHVWPLLKTLVADGLSANIAIGLDLADASMWAYRGGAGLNFLPEQIIPRLRSAGFDEPTIADLTGQNIARRLAFDQIGTR